MHDPRSQPAADPGARPVPAIPLGGYPPGDPRRAGSGATEHRPTSPVRPWFASSVAIVGTLILGASTVLPWAEISTGAARWSRSGWSDPGGDARWGVLLCGLAATIALCQVALLVGAARVRAGFAVALAAAGAAAAVTGLSVLALVEAGRAPFGAAVEIQAGPFLGLSGALVTLVGTALVVVGHPDARVSPPRAVGAVG